MHEIGQLLLVTAARNATAGHFLGDDRTALGTTIFSDVAPADLAGALYKFGRKEYGRCIGKMYVDTNSRGTIHTGYIFEKRTRYEDSDETYLHETWLSLERVTGPREVESVDLADVAASAIRWNFWLPDSDRNAGWTNHCYVLQFVAAGAGVTPELAWADAKSGATFPDLAVHEDFLLEGDAMTAIREDAEQTVVAR